MGESEYERIACERANGKITSVAPILMEFPTAIGSDSHIPDTSDSAITGGWMFVGWEGFAPHILVRFVSALGDSRGIEFRNFTRIVYHRDLHVTS